MPIFPEVGWMVQNQPSVSEQAQRALDLKGQLPLQQVDPHLALGIQVDDWSQFEYKYLKRSIPFCQVAAAAAVAAQFPQVCLQFNGAGGNRNTGAIVRRVTFINRNAAAQTVAFGVNFTGNGGTAGAVAGLAADDRCKGNPGDLTPSAYRFAQGTAAVPLLTTAGQGLRFVTLSANSTLVCDVDYVLSNRLNGAGLFGSNLFFEGLTVFQFLELTVEWEERQLLTSEL